ncbi:MAG: prepilin peptidase [Planctomycetota bacterium]
MSRRKRPPNWPYCIAWISILGGVSLYVIVQTLIGASTFAKFGELVDWHAVVVSALLDATVACWFFAVGASIGSFVNVVAYRLPQGRSVGGNSQCPYCRTAISRGDNIPILGWFKLRGRCRTCRLPIPARYVAIEIAVAVVFSALYYSEFYFGGGNLPGVAGLSLRASALVRVAVSAELVVRMIAYAFALGGLIAAALIAVRKQKVPLGLYLWCLLPIVVSAVVLPSSQIVRWREVLPEGVDVRLDALATVLCGCVAGIAMARLLAPLLFPGFDRSLMSSDQETSGARQFVGAMAVAGALLGWQAVIPFTFVLLLCAIIAVRCLRRFADVAWMADLTVWAWLGLLVFRAFWKSIYSLHVYLPDFAAPVVICTIGALATAPLAVLFCWYSRSITPEPKKELEQDEDDDEEDGFESEEADC